MTLHTVDFAARLAAVRARIDAAALRAGRAPDDITLLPVSKTFGPDHIRAAITAGERRFGENKAQEIATKHDALADAGIQWVMIGHLQTNKAKDIARYASELQSLDRLSLAQALERRLQVEGRGLDVLVQLKTSSEPSKHGLPPDALPGFLRQLAQEAPSLRVRGVMTMAINETDPDAIRACFRTARLWRDRVRQEAIGQTDLSRLSMGMSGDFELAIEEGATEVRIGSALFGHRSPNETTP